MSDMRCGWGLMVVLGVLSSGAGCGGAVGSGDEMPPPPDVLALTGASMTLSSSFPAELRLSSGAPSLIDFWFSASNGEASVSFFARLTALDLDAATAAVVVSDGPIANDVANVTARGVTSLAGASAALHFANGRVTGTISPVGGYAWTVDGLLSVSCWVPTAELPASERPAGGVPGALSSDASLTAPECRGLGALAGPSR
jgi:hypothetical protein